MTDNTLSRLREWGDGFFTTVRFHDGRFLNLPRHLKRLDHSAALFRMKFLSEPTEFLQSVENKLPSGDGLFRLECSSDTGFDGARTVTFSYSTRELSPVSDNQRLTGVDLTISSIPYHPPMKAIQWVKLLAWQPWALLRSANPDGFDLLVNDGVRLFEGTRTSLIGYRDGRFFSNQDSGLCLLSTTVDLFHVFLERSGKKPEQTEFLINEIDQWDELFVLNAGIGMLPVRSVQIPGLHPFEFRVNPEICDNFLSFYLQS